TFVVNRNLQSRLPVHRSGLMEGQEHGFEQRTALVTTFELLRRDVQATELQAQAVNQCRHPCTLADGCQVLVQDGLTGAPGEAPLGVRHQRPVAQPVGLLFLQLVAALVAIIGQHDKDEGRGQQHRAANTDVAAQEVQCELHTFAAAGPAFLQALQRDTADGLETRLAGGEGHHGLEEDAQVEIEVVVRAALLERLELLQRVAPHGRDLRQGQVGAAQLGAQRVDPDEDLGHLVIAHAAFQHVHPVNIATDSPQPGQALGVLLGTWVVQAGYPGLLEEVTVALGLEHVGDPDPMRQLFQLPGRHHEGHLVEPGHQLVFAGVAILVVIQLVVEDRKSTRLNSSHVKISYALFCWKEKNGGIWWQGVEEGWLTTTLGGNFIRIRFTNTRAITAAPTTNQMVTRAYTALPSACHIYIY